MAGIQARNILALFGFLLILNGLFTLTEAQCTVPDHFLGDYFSMERGDDVDTLINQKYLQNKFFNGECRDRWDDNSTLDAAGHHDSKILFYSLESSCYKCYYFLHQSTNIIQYKQTDCDSSANQPSLEEICDRIHEFSDLYTFFRKTLNTINCKNTFEGVFHFTYEWDVGGGGICNNDRSQIVACQEPGSPYVDNQVFTMNFAKCPDVTTSVNRLIKFQCMGTWEDEIGNIWSGVADLGKDVYRERFRCMLTRYDQEMDNNERRYTMSWWADCSKLSSPYDGPVRLVLVPVIGGFQLEYTQPMCNFPTNFSGSWYHSSELDVFVDINMTHIYFSTLIDQFTYKESYFICMMNSGTRYLTIAITVGKCEIDYVCFDLLPRHHSIIRWRMEIANKNSKFRNRFLSYLFNDTKPLYIGKPYRLTEIEMAYPDWEMYMFRQACTWSSFTINRDEIAWNYKTFLLDPPVPIPCPIRGRYFFTQKGPESELFQTRIRGITQRPRHMIDCRHYVTEWKSCDEKPSRINIDAEYCETVDHTGRPIGEYDIPDWELTCIGHWDEDWNSYLITWDPEDATSAFRCWNYERLDWRHIVMARSTGAACSPALTSRSHDPEEGASLALEMEESERLFDDCAMQFIDGDPWMSPVHEDVHTFDEEEDSAQSVELNKLTLICAVAVVTILLHILQ